MAAILTLGFSTAALASGGSTRSAQANGRSAELQAQIDQVLAAHPGGTQISPNSIAWHNGSVILTLPTSGSDRAPADLAAISHARIQPGTGAQPAIFEKTWHGCPYSDWFGGEHFYCFYADRNFGGRKLQFRGSSCPGVKDNFTVYGFNDKTRSWVNTTGRSRDRGHVISVFRDTRQRGLLWEESPNSAVSDVGRPSASSWSC